ncbi:hypothetical protein FDK12_07845 [Arthrobacter sp. NamB2]|uniref:8-oxoguanine DNA glycosylase OGG fold protein n=1 Tax=Arthrobacter sp. NamB2 TaxID=2576035 RepID=UPI0010C9AA07|nr:hypothetical protein [Arthrobacter sp. NamB2]TKV28561.1 hypothetical protein FDK12_07845 [Arthrobacter sp. NamB2]
MINEEALLPDDVLSTLPGREAVLGHAVAVDGERWRRALVDRALPAMTGKLASGGRTTVTRQEVFDLGDQDRTVENAFQLLYYSLAWGLGTRASRLHQRLDGLAKHQDTAGERLVCAWTSVRNGDPTAEAYSLLTTNRGGGRIPWFGPAFSTKFLYFAQGSTTAPRYLILDQVVTRNLRRDVWPDAPTAGWWPDTYQRYCTLLTHWATQASANPDMQRTVWADEIELALFKR